MTDALLSADYPPKAVAETQAIADLNSLSYESRHTTITSAPLIEALSRGWVELDGATLRKLRLSRFMSQQDLANDCWHRDIRVSIATIKRAECGHAVRFRIARELARCFDVPVASLVRR